MGAVRAMPVGFDILFARRLDWRGSGPDTGILRRGLPAVGWRGWGRGGAFEAADRTDCTDSYSTDLFVSCSGFLSIGVVR